MFKVFYIIPFGSFYVLLYYNNCFIILFELLYYNWYISFDNELKNDEICRGTILLFLLLFLYITLLLIY